MNDELAKMFLIKRLRKQRPSGECVTVARLMDDAANEIKRLTAEVRRLDHSTTHTCWDECPRLACAQRREIEALTAQLAVAREEGWNAAIEAAAGEAVKGRNYWRDKCNATKVRRESRDYETMAIACVHVEHAIRARALSEQAAATVLPDTVGDSDGDDGA